MFPTSIKVLICCLVGTCVVQTNCQNLFDINIDLLYKVIRLEHRIWIEEKYQRNLETRIEDMHAKLEENDVTNLETRNEDMQAKLEENDVTTLEGVEEAELAAAELESNMTEWATSLEQNLEMELEWTDLNIQAYLGKLGSKF